MNKEKAIAELKLVQELGDIEEAHARADEILCLLLRELGCNEVVDEFEQVEKWYA